jgi:hypothetical protein
MTSLAIERLFWKAPDHWEDWEAAGSNRHAKQHQKPCAFTRHVCKNKSAVKTAFPAHFWVLLPEDCLFIIL